MGYPLHYISQPLASHKRGEDKRPPSQNTQTNCNPTTYRIETITQTATHAAAACAALPETPLSQSVRIVAVARGVRGGLRPRLWECLRGGCRAVSLRVFLSGGAVVHPVPVLRVFLRRCCFRCCVGFCGASQVQRQDFCCCCGGSLSLSLRPGLCQPLSPLYKPGLLCRSLEVIFLSRHLGHLQSPHHSSYTQ